MIPLFFFSRKNFRLFLLLFGYTLVHLLGEPMYAQTSQRGPGLFSCGTDEWLINARKSKTFREQENLLNEKIKRKVVSRGMAEVSIPVSPIQENKIIQSPQADTVIPVYIVPLVFHILSSDPESVPDEAIFTALKELNDAFAHRNAYSGDTNGVNTHIQFCMARTRPDGGWTNGIDRVNTFYGDHDFDMEMGKPQDQIIWDPSRYVNVWLVNSIQSELKPSEFKCGLWSRMRVGGYASLGGGFGAVVGGLGAPLVAHELGHYLSLLHTFDGMDCKNTDCLSDGDRVCDTPPDKSIKGSPCSDPENSCNTDTVSGPFTKDVADNISNFMDYSSPCPTVFTQGQTDRMRSFLELYVGGALINSTVCTPPCTDTVQAKFNWNSNPHPITGDTVEFVNTSEGGVRYKWYVNDSLVDSSVNLRYGFIKDGKYKVELLVFNADSSCFSSYTGNVFVNCGVYARFSPTDRVVASKTDLYSYPTRFWNKSWGATEYSWYITDINGNETMVSNGTDLIYDFPEPGNYRIRLVARNGTCVDESPSFVLPVEDPTADAQMKIKQIDCYKDDSIRIVFVISNTGYDTIPANVSVSFYDRADGTRMTPVFYTDDMVIGKCEKEFVHIVKVLAPKQDFIFGVVNEDKSVIEKSYANNSAALGNFQTRLGLSPSVQKVYVNSDTVVNLSWHPGPPAKITWTSNMALSCVNCVKPVIRVTDTAQVMAVSESLYGCHDTAQAVIHVYPVDLIYKTREIYCFKNDSMLVTAQICLGNRYRSIKRDVELRYFNANPVGGTAALLGNIRIPKESVFTDSCMTLTSIIKMTSTGVVHGYLNDTKLLYEDNFNNNISAINYIPLRIRFTSASLNVYRNEPVQIKILHTGEPYVRLAWTPATKFSCTDCPAPFYTTANNDKLKVVASTQYDCLDSALLEVRAFSRNHLVLPNVFTPNGDGRNDHFYVIASEKVSIVRQFQIFNRWGEKVFEAVNVTPNDYASGWDGNFKGKQAPIGTYVYVVKVQLTTGEVETYNGNISILR